MRATHPAREGEAVRESEKEKKERKVEVELSLEEQEEARAEKPSPTPRENVCVRVSVQSCEVLSKQSSCLLNRRRNPECAEPDSTI